MTTTFEKFAGAKRHNYCTLPTKDVEILPDVRLCQTCGEDVKREGSAYSTGRWVHADPTVPDHGYVGIKTRCAYCRSQEAVYRQHAWFDAVECDRCGGVDGYAIGD